MPAGSSSVIHWIVIVFGGLSAVAVIALVAYWLVMELTRGPAGSNAPTPASHATTDTPNADTERLNDRG